MKAIISGIKRMEIHDGDGLRTTVFFKGCPLKCIWCHNPESISFEPQIAKFSFKCICCNLCQQKRNLESVSNCPTGALTAYGQEYEIDDLLNIVLQDEPFYRNSGGGVTLSGGECLMQSEFVVEFAKQLFQKGISVYVDTCGYVKREVLDSIIPYTDVFLYDIKAIDPDVHKICTGKDNALILENLKYLSDKGCKIEVRYPLVVGYNDTECEKIGAFLQTISNVTKIKVLKYHNYASSRYEALDMENTLPDPKTTDEDVEKATQILRSYGLKAINGVLEK